MKKIVLLISIFSFNISYGNTLPQKNEESYTVVLNKIEANYRTLRDNYSSNNGDSLKYAYAEFVNQFNYRFERWVNGNHVSLKIKKDVAAATYVSDALDILGSDGWELISTVKVEFTNGYGVYYYFKKRIF